MVDEPVDGGDRDGLVGEDAVPGAEGLVGSDGEAPGFVSLGDEFEEDGALGLILLWDGEQVWVTCDERPVHAVADLPFRDALLLLRDGQATIRTFFLPDDTRLTVRGDEGLHLVRQDALVRREAWAAVEQWVLKRGTAGAGAFDFRQFVYNDTEFAFTHQQALALRFMVERTQAGAPDQHYLEILKAAGSESQRIGSLFSRKPHWCHLLRKTPGRRGWYYLDPAFVVWLTRSG